MEYSFLPFDIFHLVPSHAYPILNCELFPIQMRVVKRHDVSQKFSFFCNYNFRVLFSNFYRHHRLENSYILYLLQKFGLS